MGDDTPAKPRMSLYANLLNAPTGSGDAPGTISSAPVVYKQPGGDKNDDIIAAAKAKLSAAALRFQPTKRPTAVSQKPKNPIPKATSISQVAPAPPLEASADTSSTVERQVPKSTIEDWAVDADEDAYYLEQKRQQQQRGGRKKRRKNKDNAPQPVNWDDIYDPSRPNNYDEYKHSEESIREIRDWKDVLYAHRRNRQESSLSDSDDDQPQARYNKQFAPPVPSFAPPPDLNNPPAPPPHPAAAPDDFTGDDAYARRMRLSQLTPAPAPSSASGQDSEAPHRPNMPQPDISRAPVRYNFPAAPADIPASEAELEDALQQEEEAMYDTNQDISEAGGGPRSLRPGQKGFAERLMNKYGWTKGSGLGAHGTGITTALRVQVEKAKRKPDSEGGGFVAGTQARGKILGGKKKKETEEESVGRFGAMTEVVVLLGMVDGMDLQKELGEGNLMQEIGEECGEKYGRVERVFIDQSVQGSVPVFVKFISQLSALRAVNALEGRIFNGNTITARFFDKDRFDRGDYAP